MQTRSLFFLATMLLSAIVTGQEWRQYLADDAVRDFTVYKGNAWVVSGSGLSSIDLVTLEKTQWNLTNSDIPHHRYHQLAIDSAGGVWMGLDNFQRGTITRFDGQHFQEWTDINGRVFSSLLDIQATPDGKVWMLANTIPNALYEYDQGAFISIPLPSPELRYHRNSTANIYVHSNNHVWAILTNTDTDLNYIGEYNGFAWTLHDISFLGIKPESEDAWARDPAGNIYLLCLDRAQPSLLRYDGVSWTGELLPLIAAGSAYLNAPLSIDPQGNIRILLEDNTFLLKNGNAWEVIPMSTMGFDNGHPQKLIIDGSGQWWVGYDVNTPYYRLGKLFRQNGSAPEVIRLGNSELPSNEIFSVFSDELNNKWMQSSPGLLKYDGQSWHVINYPESIDLVSPYGSDRNGGIWLQSYDTYLALFDGVTVSTYPVINQHGETPPWVDATRVDQQGRVFVAAADSRIMVFDHREISYLPQAVYVVDPDFSFPDYPNDLAFGPTGTLYALAYVLYEFRPDSTWRRIDLWDMNAYPYQLDVSPDNVVWVGDVNSSNDGLDYFLFSGQGWSQFASPYLLLSRPKWDTNGDPWFKTDQGLCKYANQEWTCYNRTNSPLVKDIIDAFSIDSFNNVWILLRDGGLMVFNEQYIQDAQSEELPTLTGQVYRDMNQNGMPDGDDFPLALHRTLLMPDSVYAFSQFSGHYQLRARNGEHTLRYIPRDNWQIDNTPSSYTIEVNDTSITDLNFAVAPLAEKTEIGLYVADGFPRCNTISRYTISFSSRGTLPEDVRITFVLDPDVTYAGANPEPDEIFGDTLRWFRDDLIPFGAGNIKLDLHIPGGEQDSIFFYAFIEVLIHGEYVLVDSVRIAQEVRCSYDPNDKLARTVRSNQYGHSLLEDPLDYTIRFQNTGNDTAFQIVIRDTLDVNLNVNTLEITGASHPYEVFLKPDRTLEFRFSDILLPDSTTNEIASHGFVSYRIFANPNLPPYTVIENTAHIYFDYNGSIKTNTATNTLVDVLTSTYDEPSLSSLLRAYPVPAKDELHVEGLDSGNNRIEFSLQTLDGKPVLAGTVMPGETTSIPLAAIPPGMYLLRATSGILKESVAVLKL